MTIVKPGAGPGIGLHPGETDIVAWNRTSVTFEVGDVVQVDIAASATEATQSTSPGGDDSGFAQVVQPANIKNGIMGVVVDLMNDAGADDTKVKVRLQGICDAYVIAASGNATIGEGGVAAAGADAASNNFDAVHAADEKITCIFLETKTTPTSRVLAKVWVDGINGFGVDAGT